MGRLTNRSGTLTLTGRAAALAGLAGLVFACEEPPAADTVTVSPGTAELPALATTVRLTAEVRDQYGQVMAGVPVTWSSGNASVAKVDGSGLVTAVGNGTAAISAEAKGVSGSAKVTVAQVVSEVVVAPAADTLVSLGDTVRLTAQARDANGHTVERVQSFAWSSGDASVATVDESGLATSVDNGTAAIGAEAEGVSGSATLTVAQVVSEVVLAPAADTLVSLGDTVRLAAEARDANGHKVERVRSFAWTSGDSSVAAVDGSGLVTAVDNGTAAIGAEAEGVSGSATLTVAQVVSEVAVTPSADTVMLADSLRLDALALDANGYEVAGARFSWESGNTSVARVDTSGTVTGVGEGEATVTARSGSAQGRSEIDVVNQDRETLAKVYHATGGPNWRNSDNWLSDAKLESWHGVWTDSIGLVKELHLVNNGLSGALPPELGDLARLKQLRLSVNSFSGAIPPELGRLTELEALGLFFSGLSGAIPPELGNLKNLKALLLPSNRLTGEIPPELGGLGSLEVLFVNYNQLTGAIPPELGNASKLTHVRLGGNGLTGEIPPELGDLDGLLELDLSGNDLSGEIPPELGDLADLYKLALSGNSLTGEIPARLDGLASVDTLLLDLNALTGAIPPELGSLDNLRVLDLAGNTGMSGELSEELTELDLDVFFAGNTDLCVPREPTFVTWVSSILRRRISFCEGAMAYLVQAVQSRSHPVPQVADERALLRVFVTAKKKTEEGIPLVRATFFVDGDEEYEVDIPAKSTPIPTEVDEGDLSKSANAEIPGRVVQPDLEMVIEIDPDGTLDEDLGVLNRIPETGRMPVEVRRVPLLDLTMVPFLWSEDPDSSVLEIVADMAEDPEGHKLLELTHMLLPVADFEVTAHEAVASSSNSAFALLSQTAAIRAVEGGTGYWMGTLSGTVTGAAGVAYLPGWVSFSILDSLVIAHELGHNMSLFHAPGCGASGADPKYPYSGGTIGTWGYDSRESGRLVDPETHDLLTYCKPRWISDYHATKAVAHRLIEEDSTAERDTAQSLLLWGGEEKNGDLVLNPAFVVDALPMTSPSAGDHRITGRTEDGRELFSVGFGMTQLSEGGSSFAFVLPASSWWAGSLATITLYGPDGEVALDGESDLPMAILRDPRTGSVRAMLRDLPELADAEAVAELSARTGMVVRFSRGIPDADAWRR